MTAIGFIGLGNMGAPMAANLVKAGHQVTGYDLVPAAMAALAANGGRAAASAAEAIAAAEIVITMLPAGPQVREVYLGNGGILGRARKERIADRLLDDRCRHRSRRSRQRRMRPASKWSTRRSRGARRVRPPRRLTFMVGGEASVIRTRPADPRSDGPHDRSHRACR